MQKITITLEAEDEFIPECKALMDIDISDNMAYKNRRVAVDMLIKVLQEAIETEDNHGYNNQ